jgi:hypothetical protein
VLEASLVIVAADAGACIRDGIADDNLDNVRARMLARQNMSDRRSSLRTADPKAGPVAPAHVGARSPLASR